MEWNQTCKQSTHSQKIKFFFSTENSGRAKLQTTNTSNNFTRKEERIEHWESTELWVGRERHQAKVNQQPGCFKVEGEKKKKKKRK